MNASAAHADLVRAARRGGRWHALVRGVECVAAGSLGAAIVFTAGIASGADATRDLVLVAAAIGALTSVLMWSERPPRVRQVVLRTDRAVGLGGALATVLDDVHDSARHSTREPSLTTLLTQRVHARVRPIDFLRAASPRTPLALAAPLVGAALIALALDLRLPPSAPTLDATIAGTAASLRGAAERQRARGDVPGAETLEIAARSVEAAANGPAGAETSAERAIGLPTSAVREPAPRERAARALERLAESADANAAAREELERAARSLRAAPADDGRRPSAPGLASGSSGAQVQPGGAAEGASSPASAPGGLAKGGGDGRMLGPSAGGESDPRPGPPTNGTTPGGGPSRGVVSARWWPRRYDEVVERYLTP